MDKNNKSVSKGRGSSLLEMIKRQAQCRPEGLSHSLETPSVSSSDQTRTSEENSSPHLQSSSGSSVRHGRISLNMLKSMSNIRSESSSTDSSSIGVGRGALLGLAKRITARLV